MTDSVRLGDQQIQVNIAEGTAEAPPASKPLGDVVDADPSGETTSVPLKAIAFARSGDKGDKANIGVMARRPEFVSVIHEQLGTDRVAALFSCYLAGDVQRWELHGLHAVNNLLDAAVGGPGGTSTLRYDPQGKSYATMLLWPPVIVPVEWEREGLLAGSMAVAA
jgi:hypothetical protein